MSHEQEMLNYASGYASAQERIEQLESWILEAITKPYMPRELRLEGLDLLNPVEHRVKQAVERICPTQVREMGLEQGIER